MSQRSYKKSQKLLGRAEKSLAGGVGSNFRRKEKPFPLYFSHGEGSKLWDCDGNLYIDFVLGQGPLLLGHCHRQWAEVLTDQLSQGQLYAGQSELEIDLSETLQKIIPGAERVRYGNSSSEVIQLAVRIARAYTGRSGLIKMEGHYHGWFDNVLISVHPTKEQAGSYAQPNAVLHSTGQDPKVGEDILISHYNDLEHLETIFKAHPRKIAAVLIEPVMCNSGCILPQKGYLGSVKKLCRKYGAILIFDETITGFRVSLGGATELFGVTPDLGIYGKGLGGGMPVSCLVGKKNIMDCVSNFEVFHAGTFNTNLLALRSAMATIKVLSADSTVYQQWDSLGQKLRSGLEDIAAKSGVNLLVRGIGQITYTGFGDNDMLSYRDCWDIDNDKVQKWVTLLKNSGIRIISRGLWYLSTAHSQQDINTALSAADKILGIMKKN